MSDSTEYRNALELSTKLCEYQLKSVLGVGGFGMTYLAWDTNLEKYVAIKEYLPGDLAVRALDGSIVPVSTNHQFDYQWGLDAFIQEARTLARFSHPHIVRVNRYFEANGTGYMVMDYEEGESLNQLLKRSPHPPENVLRSILLPLLDGLAAVHAAKFLHRDIKPSNIFIRANGSPVLLDFGAARATSGGTRTLTAVLTPGFAPLEQYAVEGKQGPWSDIYAMAGVMFRAVTNSSPPDAVSRLHGDTVPQRLAEAQGRYSAPLLRAIEWALSIKAELRPQSIAEWKAAFDAQVQGTAMPRAAAAPAAAGAATAAIASRTAATRPLPERSDPRAGWRHLGLGILLILALLAGLDWHKRHPLEADAPPPAPPPEVRESEGDDASSTNAPATAPAPAVNAGEVGARPPEPQPAREFAPVADPLERPPRPEPNTPIPERARERVSEEFRGADRNRDGYLSPAEIDGRFPAITRDFSTIDRDGDRRLSLDEFITFRRLQFEARRVQPPPRP
jgi:serine/threonine protein kinase